MKNLGFLIVMAALSGCGVDGEPVRPAVNTTVSAGTHGVHVGTGVSATKGNVTLGVGLGL
jgi:hypothetical protein